MLDDPQWILPKAIRKPSQDEELRLFTKGLIGEAQKDHGVQLARKMEWVAGLCDRRSPIAKKMAVALVYKMPKDRFQGIGHFPGNRIFWAEFNMCDSLRFKVEKTKEIRFWHGNVWFKDTALREREEKIGLGRAVWQPFFPGVWVFPEVAIGRYKIDFMISVLGGGCFANERPMAPIDKPKLFAIECDGWAWHRDRIEYDRDKDWALQQWGIEILRPTGRLINNDTALLEYVDRIMERVAEFTVSGLGWAIHQSEQDDPHN